MSPLAKPDVSAELRNLMKSGELILRQLEQAMEF